MIRLNQLVRAKISDISDTQSETNKPSSIDSNSRPLDHEISKEVDDLQGQLQESIRDYNVVNLEIEKLQNELRYNKTTESELKKLPKNEAYNMYRRVGKMFMKSTRKYIYDKLQDELSDDSRRINDFSKKKVYLEHQIKCLQKSIRELSIEC